MTVGSGTEHAEGAEKRKVDAYKTAMQRNRESAARARRQPDDFAPLGFAKNGAWGPQAQRIFKDLCAMLRWPPTLELRRRHRLLEDTEQS